MNKLYIILLCVSSAPLWAMKQLTKDLENVSLVANSKPEKMSLFGSPLEERELYINAFKRTLEDGEWTPLPMAQQVGREYKALQEIASLKEETLDKKKLEDLANDLFDIYDLLIEELTARMETLDEKVIEYVALTDAEKAVEAPILMDWHDSAVNIYNALSESTMWKAYSEVEDDLPILHAKIIEVRRALGIE